jgi:hypothetical protein
VDDNIFFDLAGKNVLTEGLIVCLQHDEHDDDDDKDHNDNDNKEDDDNDNKEDGR